MVLGIGSPLGLATARVARAMAQDARRALGGELGRVVTLGDALGRAVERTGAEVVVVVAAEGKRGGRRKGPSRVVSSTAALPFEDGGVDASMAAARSEADLTVLAELARIVRDGGLVAVAVPGPGLVRRPPTPERLAAAFVHAALVDVEQHPVGGVLVTTGRVRRASR